MRSILIILYIVCFSCYVLFTRQPDYFDSEQTIGIVASKNDRLVAVFSDGKDQYAAEVTYQFMHHAGEKCKVIYELADPSKSKLYTVVGYWIIFGELAASVFIVMALYWVAVSITSNPTQGALLEELEAGKKKPRKPKYDL